MSQFTLKQLRYFVVAGELCSVTRAARKLHVSQPSISAAIRQIEDVTGLQLFVRHHSQGLSLTPSGRQLLNRAQQLLHGAEGLEKYALSLREEIGGELRLVTFPTFATAFLPRLLRRYAGRHPSVNLYCDEMNQVDIVRGLGEGEYELAFTYDFHLTEEIDFTPLRRFPPYAVVAVDHPLSERNSVRLAELVAHPMVLLDWPLSREYFLSIFGQYALSPVVAHRAKSIDMVCGLVANGLGFSLFNTPPPALDEGGLRPLRLEDVAPALTMGIACLRGLQLSPAADAMYGLVRDAEVQGDVFARFSDGLAEVPDHR